MAGTLSYFSGGSGGRGVYKFLHIYKVSNEIKKGANYLLATFCQQRFANHFLKVDGGRPLIII